MMKRFCQLLRDKACSKASNDDSCDNYNPSGTRYRHMPLTNQANRRRADGAQRRGRGIRLNAVFRAHRH